MKNEANEVLVLTADDFLYMESQLLKIGFRKKSKYDSRRTFARLNLSPPRHIDGREASYIYNHNGYTVILHSTYLEDEKKWRDKGTDIGWNLIAEKDVEKYFARPFQRTKGFIIKFLRYAWISKWKVDHRPLCPTCNKFMNIHRKNGTRQYSWACFNNDFHENHKSQFLPWDHNLPPKAAEFVKIRRSYTARYKAKNKKAGKIVVPAAVIRKKWKISNPQNIEK